MIIKLEKNSDSDYKIILTEKFNFSAVDKFRKCYEEIDSKTRKKIVVDFKLTKYMDSSALGMLLNFKKHFDNQNVDIRLINTNKQIHKILSISGFDRKFVIEQ